ncbi:MAG: hypothetical protein ACFFD1_06425 [Candidatus Thorarchaeota archaeon]
MRTINSNIAIATVVSIIYFPPFDFAGLNIRYSDIFHHYLTYFYFNIKINETIKEEVLLIECIFEHIL